MPWNSPSITRHPNTIPGHQQLIGPNNEDIVKIDDFSYRALIDSGSQVTSITEDLWKEHPKLGNLALSSADVSIEGASGHRVPYLGVIPVSLTIMNVVYEDVPAFVVPTDKYRRDVPILIGTNVIRTSKRDQQIKRGVNYMKLLQIENPAWHAAFSNTTNSEPGDQRGSIGYAKYIGRSVRVIPPGKEEYIICQAPSNQGFPYTVVVENLLQTSSCLKVSNLVADIGPNCRVPVRLCNISAKPIVIKRNSRLAQLSSILRVDVRVHTPLQS